MRAFFGACVCAYPIDPQFVQPVPATPGLQSIVPLHCAATPIHAHLTHNANISLKRSTPTLQLSTSRRPITPSTPPSKVAKVRTQEIPTLPVEQLCRAASTQNSNPFAAGDAKAAFDHCMQAERSIREQVTKEWVNFSQADKQHCVSLVQMGGSAGYAELITCLEMAREVRQSKDSSANPQRKQ